MHIETIKMESFETNDIFGLSRDLPLNYIERPDVDFKLKQELQAKSMWLFMAVQSRARLV